MSMLTHGLLDITSFMCFILFAVLSAVSKNVAMLIVVRTLSGGAAASVQAVGAGSIADVWEPRERGRAMGLFYLGPLCGPLFAPIFGGALGSSLGWRSTQWFLVIYGSATLIFIILALPETLHRPERAEPSPTSEADTTLNRTSTRASTIQKTKSFLTHLRQIFIDPLTSRPFSSYHSSAHELTFHSPRLAPLPSHSPNRLLRQHNLRQSLHPQHLRPSLLLCRTLQLLHPHNWSTLYP